VQSADFLEALGANISTDPTSLALVISQCNFGFLFAQKFHPAMRHVAQVRKQLGVRTVFNFLGPLTNPARPNAHVIGKKKIVPVLKLQIQIFLDCVFFFFFFLSLFRVSN
jgi:anthranilate phosphoribosyltransferase